MYTTPTQLQFIIKSDPEVLGGTPCFQGTRVPLATFLDYVESGYSLEDFLRGYPSVVRNDATTVLEWLSDNSRQLLGLAIVA